MPVWHAEVTALVLRRYQADDAETAFAAALPYDGTAIVRLILGRAHVGPLQVCGPPVTRAEKLAVEEMLRQYGARKLVITRHGRLVERELGSGRSGEDEL